jgi:ArsR family transcriptional regulator, arsenate/arsenite/antimonite-responsive transcriptional repressor
MQSTLVTEDHGVRSLTRLFRALADETRVRIVAMLAHGELCVCHLERALEQSQPNISRHLGILRAAEVVESRRDGTWVYYRIAPQQHAAVAELLAALVRSFGAERAIRADHGKLRKACGPGACK